jgi:hypothetical protein
VEIDVSVKGVFYDTATTCTFINSISQKAKVVLVFYHSTTFQFKKGKGEGARCATRQSARVAARPHGGAVEGTSFLFIRAYRKANTVFAEHGLASKTWIMFILLAPMLLNPLLIVPFSDD